SSTFRTRRSASTASASRSAVERTPGVRRPSGVVDRRADAFLRGASFACRPLAAMARPRRGRARGGRLRPGDEAHRLEPARARRERARPRPVRDPPRPELGHRVRPLRGRDAARDGADGARGRLDARLLRPLRLAPPGAARRARPLDRRQRLESRRPHPAWLRDRLPRLPLLARVQPRRHVHHRRRRDPLRRRALRRLAAQLTLRVRVPEEAAGERLDRYLASLPDVGSRAEAERLLAAGAVRVHGEARSKSHRLEGGEEVALEPSAPAPAELVPEERELRIAYED